MTVRILICHISNTDGLKNRILSAIFHRSDGFKMKFNMDYQTGGISVKKLTKSKIYRFGTDKSTKKSSM